MRYKQAIQIGDNVTDIMKLPCVIDVNKAYDDNGVLFYKYRLFGDTITNRIKWGETVIAHVGDWLIEDEEGRWHVMTDEEWTNP